MIRIFSFIIFLMVIECSQSEESCRMGEERSPRYLLYDVNPGEGFNLRRDVYIRMANLVRKLSQFDNWVLVLPPWGNLYHWRNIPRGTYFPWKTFFDLQSLKKWINIIEFEDYLKENGPKVDSVYILQHYAEGWGGQWEEKYDERPCINENPIKQRDDGLWVGRKWGTSLEITNFKCLSIQGQAASLLPLLNTDANIRSIYIGRAETVLHDEYGGVWYWSARRSMIFAKHLQEEADNFRHKVLNSDNAKDGTKVMEDWRDMKPVRGKAMGGAYMSVHLRRMDFVRARPDEVPDLNMAAKQINQILKKENLATVFVATDAPLNELDELKELVEGSVVWYEPGTEILEAGGDGAVAIIDQIIAAHARYFVGTYESTFSFRIQEEREILGFQEETTFNRLCGKKEKCEQPSKWRITY